MGKSLARNVARSPQGNCGCLDGRVPRSRYDPDFLYVPLRADIDPLIDRAIEAARAMARRHTTAKPERDHAVVAILRAYRYLTVKRRTAKPAESFCINDRGLLL